MNILLIDNRRYTYNAEIHIDFFSKMQAKHNIVGLGNHLEGMLKRVHHINGKKNQISSILAKHKIDAVVSYNAAGNNVDTMRWFANDLSKIDIPKFHITTDYCRNEFNKKQAKWFENVGYTHAFFRHKISTGYPLEVPKSWLPFSFNSKKYNKLSIKNIDKKKKLVAFSGAAHFSAKTLYRQRIRAIDYLDTLGLMRQPPMRPDGKKQRQRVIGDDYIEFYTNYLFGLTCGGLCDYFVAKYIQIPAMHCLLVCTDTVGLEGYPKDTYIKYDINNLDKLKTDIKYHIKNIDETKLKIKKLNNYVNKKHNNEIRTEQFVKIIKRYL